MRLNKNIWIVRASCIPVGMGAERQAATGGFVIAVLASTAGKTPPSRLAHVANRRNVC